MKPGLVSLSRLEFSKISIEINPDYKENPKEGFFPQIEFDFNNVSFELGTDLMYPDEEIDDPRHFTLMVRLSVQQESQENGLQIPYSVTIEGFAYLFFKGKEDGEKRFKIVRGTGYMMLYGAFREYIANFTGRSAYGVWFLPSPNFNSNVDEDVVGDMEKWEIARSAKNKSTNSSAEDQASADVSEVSPAYSDTGKRKGPGKTKRLSKTEQQ
ncbi:hypothetical protein [Massilia sp.]|uniref:hypothetical protein n=1 Tax=Massilia sp. TaxID=1882437 RepID=UPI00391DE79D